MVSRRPVSRLGGPLYVVGTAGHVDHGKSTLVRALTGIDPDRLQEEKDRGMTIDLGFAWLKLPSGREVSVVDVPGHERFIKNMLAGVGGVDVAMLVIAADEGVMPQTEEHLAILELLRVKRAIAVLTKKDLVDAEWLDLVSEDVAARLARSTLAGAPIVVVSAATGEGLDDLRSALDRALDDTPARPDLGRPRLPIDRIFTIAGFGTVVTGTLIGGCLRVGQEIEVQPSGRKVRVRGLQVHKHKVDVAEPGNRVAVNLAGVDVEDLSRGQVVTAPGWLHPTKALDVSLHVLPGARPVPHNATVSFHTGSAESPAKVSLLDADALEPGQTGWAQIRLEEPVALAKGDLFVLRSSNETLGGGEVVEPQAKRHRRRQAGVLESLALLQRGTPAELVERAVVDAGLADLNAIVRRSGLPADHARAALRELTSSGGAFAVGDHYATPASWDRVAGMLRDHLAAYHRQYPLRAAMPREELRSRGGLPAKQFNQVIERMLSEGTIATGDAAVRLAGHAPTLDPSQRQKADRLVAALADGRYSPPSLVELCASLGVDAELLGSIVEGRRIVQVSDSVAWAPEVFDEMVERIVSQIDEKGEITVAEVRDAFGASRKYALAILEHLDEARVTRRVGDARVLGSVRPSRATGRT